MQQDGTMAILPGKRCGPVLRGVDVARIVGVDDNTTRTNARAESAACHSRRDIISLGRCASGCDLSNFGYLNHVQRRLFVFVRIVTASPSFSLTHSNVPLPSRYCVLWSNFISCDC